MNNKKEPYSVGQYLQGKHEIKDFGTGEKSNDRINNLCFENYEYEKLEMVEKFHKIENLKNTKSNTEDVEDILFHISKQINPDSTSHNDKPSSSASFIKKGKRNAVTGGENSFNEGIDAEILNSSEFLEKMFGKANTGIRPLKKLDDVNEKSRDDMTSYNSVDSKEGGSHLSEDSNLVEHSYKQKNTLYTKSSIIKLTQTMDEQIETFFEKIGSMVDYYHDSFFAIFEPWLTHKKTAMNKGSAYMDNFQVGSVFNGFCFDYMDTFPDEFQNHSGYSLKDKRAELIRRGEFNNIMNKEKEEKENIKLQNFGFALCKSSAAFKNDYQTHKFVDTMYAKYNSFWFMLSNPFFDDSFYDVITCNPKLVYSTKNNQCIKEKSNENCTIKIQNEECFLRLLTRPLQTKLNFRAQIILEKVRLLRRKKLLHNGSLILQDAHSLWSSDLHRVSNSFKKSIAKLIIYGCVKEHDNDNGNKNKVEKEAPIAIPFVDKKEHYKMLVHKTRKFVIDPFIDASTVLLV
uniref:Uncharacterized protein n=1 Tax=Corethron hystrix TaxID=216773 RepID=A0A7S1BX19_9STRA|mmetsp:Transcript_5379/g.11091  ORF Transcript_5379/g.11091 Transcript_5379/m.11091 type:complete len:515 (+) Transcript_5379:1088-2632(+)